MELQDHKRQFNARGATLIAISADELGDARTMVERLELEYTVAVDPELTAIEAYGVRMKDQDIAVPATFVLNRAGEVIYRRVGETIMDRPEAEALLDVLDGKPVATP